MLAYLFRFVRRSLQRPMEMASTISINLPAMLARQVFDYYLGHYAGWDKDIQIIVRTSTGFRDRYLHNSCLSTGNKTTSR